MTSVGNVVSLKGLTSWADTHEVAQKFAARGRKSLGSVLLQVDRMRKAVPMPENSEGEHLAVAGLTLKIKSVRQIQVKGSFTSKVHKGTAYHVVAEEVAPAEARPEGVANVEGCGAGETGDPGFQEGNVCGASKEQSGGKSRAVRFDEDPWKMAKYKSAPDLRRDITDMTGAKKVRSELQKQGRLNQDGKTTSLYHITDPEYVASILKAGLIPGKEEATGQQWKAAHSDYATYFYLDKGVALDHAEQAGGMKVLEAKIPITPKSLIRILPDEDSDPDPKNGVKVLLEGGTVAYIGGVPSTHLSLVKSKGSE